MKKPLRHLASGVKATRYSPVRTAGLRRGNRPSPTARPTTVQPHGPATGRPRVGEPEITERTAHAYVTLLHAGVDPVRALRYFAADYFDACKPDALHAWLTRWSRSRTVLKAQTALMGGRWQDLDADRRIAIALDKHFAELAYYLVSRDFSTVQDVELRKMTDARTALQAKLALDKTGDPNSPFATYVQDVLAGKITLAAPALIPFDRPLPIVPPVQDS